MQCKEIELGGNFQQPPNPMKKIILVASIAIGLQFGWALQLSLLTPYIQLLGVPHEWAAFVWLCGPITGLVVQPVVGYYSDRCTSRFGRRRPFIVVGVALVVVAVTLIAYAADMGYLMGDPSSGLSKPRAVALFIVGFWVLDVGNNFLQGPCRALMADLCEDNHGMMTASNALFACFMAVGNILGYITGAHPNIHNISPSTKTLACDVYCANLKTSFIISTAVLVAISSIAVSSVSETPISESEVDDSGEAGTFVQQLSIAIKSLSKPMKMLLLLTCLNWIGWFPFLLYDTDWMGREVFGGSAGGSAEEVMLYRDGVQAGSLGLMFYVFVLALSSLAIEPMTRFFGGVRQVWGVGNLLLAVCMGMTVVVTKMAEHSRALSVPSSGGAQPTFSVKMSAWALFAILGFPQAVTLSIPFALTAMYSNSSGAGQGLSLGVLNFAIVIPQMAVVVISGPLDALFGGGNLPAFMMGAIAAAASGILSFIILPS